MKSIKCDICGCDIKDDNDIGLCLSERPLKVLCWDCSESPSGNIDGEIECIGAIIP